MATGWDGQPSAPASDAVPDVIVSPWRGAIPTRILDGVTGVEVAAGFPFGPSFAGGVRTAAGDVTGDGVVDLVLAMGPGGGLVSLLDGATFQIVGSGYPFGPAFTGGVSVAVGDINGDGTADIVTAQAGAGGTVIALDGRSYALLLASTPFGAGYGGGLHVAAGDVDGDQRADIFVGQATGGGVALINGATTATMLSAVVYAGSGGVFVAVGDVNGDGPAELVAAPGGGSGPVYVYDVRAGAVLATLAPPPAGFTGGVRVAAADLTGDGRAEILTVPGPGTVPTVRVFEGTTFALLHSYPAFEATATGGALIAAPAGAVLRFVSEAQATFQAGSAGSAAIRVVGGSSTTFSLSGELPVGVTFTPNGVGTALLSGTPAANTGGIYALAISASSGRAAATQHFTLTVTEAPAITSSAATSFSVGHPSAFTITSAGFPRPTLSLTAGQLPAGVTFSPNDNGTAIVAGTPALNAAGLYPLTVSATNGVGAGATQAFVLTVQAAPSFTSPASAVFTAGVAGSFTVTATGVPAVTSITLSGALPAGVSFTDHGNGTATLTGSAAPNTGGLHPLAFTSSNAAGLAAQNFVLTVREAPRFTSSQRIFNFMFGETYLITTSGYPVATIDSPSGVFPAGLHDHGDGTATLSGGAVFPVNRAAALRASNGVGSPDIINIGINTFCPVRFTPAAGELVTGSVGTPYAFALAATGPFTPYHYSVGSGLPPGLSLTPTGELTGIPTAAGQFAFTVTAFSYPNPNSCYGMATYSITVLPATGPTSTNVDGPGTGNYSSIAIGRDGLPIISHQDENTGGLRVTHCDDAACTSTTSSNYNDGVYVGFTSLAIGSDGFAVISHSGGVTHCANVACTSATTNAVGRHGPIAIGSDGFPIIVSDGAVTHCDDVTCASATSTELGNDLSYSLPFPPYYSIVFGFDPSIAIGPDGVPTISHLGRDTEGWTYAAVGRCNDAACTSTSSRVVAGYPGYGFKNSLAIGSDGLPIVVWMGNSLLRVIHCDDAACTTSSSISSSASPSSASVAIGTDGLAMFTRYDAADRALRMTRCSDVACTSTSSFLIDDPADDVGQQSSMAIGTNGVPIVSHYNATARALRVTTCANATCQ